MDEKWKDNYELIHAHPVLNKSYCDHNSILYTAQYILLKEKLNKLIEYDIESIGVGILAHQTKKGTYAQTPCDPNDPSSRDNTTAITCISHKFEFGYEKKIKILGHYWHPRDILLLMYLKGGISKIIAYPCLWIITLNLITSCMTHWKVRPDIFECLKVFFKTWKWPERRKMVGTDGELICFVIFNCVNLKWTQKCCEYFLKRRFGDKYWLKIFKTFFWEHEDHPNRKMAKEIWK